MTVHDPLHRERPAHDEIGRTAVSRPLAAALAGLFLLAAFAVPVAELLRPEGLAPWRDLAAATAGAVATARDRHAVRNGRDRGLGAAHRELLAAMDAFEDRLDEESAVARLARPAAQWVQTALLGAGDRQVLVGRDGWQFFVPAVEHLTGPGFLDPTTLRRRAAGDEPRSVRPSGPATAPPSPPDGGPEDSGVARAGRPSPPARVGEGSGEWGEMGSNPACAPPSRSISRTARPDAYRARAHLAMSQ